MSYQQLFPDSSKNKDRNDFRDHSYFEYIMDVVVIFIVLGALLRYFSGL